MLPFLGKAAAGGEDVRGNRHASEDGPLRDGVREKTQAELCLREKTLDTETDRRHCAAVLTCINRCLAVSRAKVN